MLLVSSLLICVMTTPKETPAADEITQPAAELAELRHSIVVGPELPSEPTPEQLQELKGRLAQKEARLRELVARLETPRSP